MSDDSGNRGGSPATLWLLLLIPAAGFAGWGLANRPVPSRPAVEATPAAVAPPTESRPTGSVQPAPPPPVNHVDPAQANDAPERPDDRANRARSQEISNWTTAQAAINDAQRTGKPILLDFNAEWCPPCRALKAELFEDPTLGLEVQRTVIPVSLVDRMREEGQNPPEVGTLQRQFGVDAFPTLVVFNPANGRSTKTSGYGGAERTLRWLHQAADAVR